MPRLLPFFVFLSACAVGEAQSARVPAESRCRVDADCVIVTAMPSCGPCGTCRGQPRALSRRYVDASARECAAQTRRTERLRRAAERRGAPMPQQQHPSCEPCQRPPASASLTYTPVCRANVCEAHVVDGGDAASESSSEIGVSP